jgi:hypothetical protein
MSYRSHHEVMVDVIVKPLDIEIEHPIVPPAAPAGDVQCLMRRATGSISIRVVMEQGFQNHLEIPFGHRLGDSVGDSGNSQRPRFSFAFTDVHPTHRQRHVAARGHPTPEPIEIVFQIPVELFDRLIFDACRTPIRLDSLLCLPHFALCNTRWLCFIHAGPPFAGCPRSKAEQRRPFGPVPANPLGGTWNGITITIDGRAA